MGSVLVPVEVDRYAGARHPRRDEGEETAKVTLRHRFVLELHLAGHLPMKGSEEKPSIHELTDYSPAMIHRILASEGIVALRQQVMSYYDQEFETLFPDVIQAVREGLDATEMKDRLSAAKLWLKAHGRAAGSSSKEAGDINITAEDVVVQILNMAEGRRVEARSES